ncbi:MAG: SDR family NAD(P)-dependent oxidoreductase [Calditrichaceae bacterium]
MFDFKGKNVIVTGGSRGIGAATVKLFMSLGANVAFNYNKNYRAAESVSKDCQKFEGEIFFSECDISDYQEVQGFINKVIDKFNHIDILVNNAGIWEYGKLEEMSVENWRKTMQVNLDSVFYFSHYIVKHMKENEIKGCIINISSAAGQRGEAFHSHYAASKGAIISFTKALASELGPDKIRVNCVAPGWVETDMSAEAIREDYDHILSTIPLGFIPGPDDLSGPVAFLASDLARAITGAVLSVNAGHLMCG